MKDTPNRVFHEEPLEALVMNGLLAGIAPGRISLKRHGFSLVELSIVLVILGLLTGGILAGRSLIRAAELRGVMTEANQYSIAARSFRDKYFAIPGDINNATSFWGKDSAVCNASPGTAGSPGTCNGDGNNQIIIGYSAYAPGESFIFWEHLQLAGLIEGSLTGLSGATNSDFLPGTNTPASKFPKGAWLVQYSDLMGNPFAFNYNLGNAFAFGTRNPGQFLSNDTLKPEEAWNIDSKLDDGKPGTGNVLANYYSPSGVGCTLASSTTDYTAAYNLATSIIACTLGFRNQF